MNPLARLRRQTNCRARCVLGFLAVAWLGVAVQPCAMAFDMASHADCVHCPQDTHAAETSHAPTAGLATAAITPHGGGAATAECTDSLADCYVLRDNDLDNRSAKLKLKDGPHDQPVMHAPGVGPVPAHKAMQPLSIRNRQAGLPGCPRPLRILHCVYLD